MVNRLLKTKPPYQPPKNGNGAAPKRPAQLATSAYIGPIFADSLDGSTIVTNGLSTRKYYRLARTNPEIRMAIRALTQATFWVKGQVQAQNDYDEHPEFQALDDTLLDLIDNQLSALSDFQRTLQDLFTYAIRCGYAVAEKIWEPVDGVWTLTGLKPKRPWDFEPVVDEFGDLQSLFYYPTGEYFDPRAFIFAPWPGPAAANWLGEPILESLYHDVQLMQKTEAALAKNAHLLSKRTMIHRFDANRDDSEIAAAKQAIADIDLGKMPQLPAMLDDANKLIHHDEIEILQDRTSVVSMTKLTELGENSARRVKRVFGLPDDLGSTSGTSGSWAKARVEFDMLLASAADGQAWLAALVGDHLIMDVVQLNYPSLPPAFRLPAWIYPEIEEKYSLQRAQYWQTLIAAGVIAPDAQVIADDLGLPYEKNIVPEKPETQAESGSDGIPENFLKINVPKRPFWRYLLGKRN